MTFKSNLVVAIVCLVSSQLIAIQSADAQKRGGFSQRVTNPNQFPPGYSKSSPYPKSRMNPVHQNNLSRGNPASQIVRTQQATRSKGNNRGYSQRGYNPGYYSVPSSRYLGYSGFGPALGLGYSTRNFGIQVNLPLNSGIRSGYSQNYLGANYYLQGDPRFGGYSSYSARGYAPYGGTYSVRSPYDTLQRSTYVPRAEYIPPRSYNPSNNALTRDPFQVPTSPTDFRQQVVTRKATSLGNFVPTNAAAATLQQSAERSFKSRDYAGAARAVDSALAKDSQNGMLWMFSGQVNFARGQYDRAMFDINTGAKLMDRNQWGFVVSNYRQYYSGNEFVTQMDRLNAHLEKNPTDYLALALRGFQFGSLGYPDAARMDMERALSISPNDQILRRLNGANAQPNSTVVLKPQPQPPIQREVTVQPMSPDELNTGPMIEGPAFLEAPPIQTQNEQQSILESIGPGDAGGLGNGGGGPNLEGPR